MRRSGSVLRHSAVIAVVVAIAAAALAASASAAQLAVVGERESNQVSLIDTSTNKVVGQPVATGEGPASVAITPDGKYAYVADVFGESVSVIETGLRRKVGEIEVGNEPFGIALFPSGNNPQWVYVANTDSVVRFPYRTGDLKATEKPETVVAELPHGGGHTTRDIVFTRGDSQMLVSVGSASNDAEARWWHWEVTERCRGLVRQYRDARFDVLPHNPAIRRDGLGAELAGQDPAPPGCPCGGDL